MPLNDEPQEGSVRYKYLYAACERNIRQRNFAWAQLSIAGIPPFLQVPAWEDYRLGLLARWYLPFRRYEDLDDTNQLTIYERDRAWRQLADAGIEIQLPLEVL